ncbi:hypothetical protein NPIL_195041, partial [Nephila pilipes]
MLYKYFRFLISSSHCNRTGRRREFFNDGIKYDGINNDRIKYDGI